MWLYFLFALIRILIKEIGVLIYVVWTKFHMTRVTASDSDVTLPWCCCQISSWTVSSLTGRHIYLSCCTSYSWVGLIINDCESYWSCFDSLAPGRGDSNFEILISQLITLRWMAQNTFDVKSELVQVMAWCHQATRHYLNQCWPRSV